MLIHTDELINFLEGCRNGEIGPYRSIHVPVLPAEGDAPHASLAPLRGKDRLAPDGHRATDPVKLLFYRVREKVAPFGDEPAGSLLAGVKACDVRGLELLDRALINDDFVDPAYRAWRAQTTVFSFDCTDAAPSCHCTLAGGTPYAESGFDANAARFGDHYFLSAASDKGRALLGLIRGHARADTVHDRMPAQVAARRAEMTALVRRQSEAFARPEEYQRLRASPTERWKEAATDCVGCGACTHICPTCYCLILNDESRSEDFAKVRSYDSCQWHGYARVASGASPRPRIDERFRHRYLCKLMRMKTEFGSLGCTGCGRCTDACPGGIDYRKVVHDLMAEGSGPRRPETAR